MGKRLRRVAEVLTAWTELFGEEAEVVGVAEHLLKYEPRPLEVAEAGKTLDVPKRAHRKRSVLPDQSVIGALANAIPVDE